MLTEEMMLSKQIGSKLREKRLSRGMTQLEVENKTNPRIDRGTVAYLELGRRPITQKKLRVIASAINVPVEELLPIREG